MRLVVDTEWQDKMRRGETQYCARCGCERHHARRYGIGCVRGRHTWSWEVKA